MEPKTIVAPSVSFALADGLRLLGNRADGYIKEPSRNGAVRVWDGPVVTHYLHPRRRVLFCPLRNANPFFHLFESLWMLGGRNDLPWLAQFNKQMAAYSDDGGKTQPAAYGHRWRSYFGYDQIGVIVEELRGNPNTRRAVLAMWDAFGAHETDVRQWPGDLVAANMGSADVPCNTHCYFTVRGNRLSMGINCRSNDILWGAYGANAVHFSVLLEYLAAHCGYEVGEMVQYSWNWHLYEDVLKHEPDDVAKSLVLTDRYTGRLNTVQPKPLFTSDDVNLFDIELPNFLMAAEPNSPTPNLAFGHPTFAHLAMPMLWAHRMQAMGDFTAALEFLSRVEHEDWKIACTEWVLRKMEKRGA